MAFLVLVCEQDKVDSYEGWVLHPIVAAKGLGREDNVLSQNWDKEVKRGNYKNFIEKLTTEMNEKEKPLVDISTQTGVSNWLTELRITKFEFGLSKQQFWDSVRLWYDWEITNLPTICPCGNKCDI